MRHNIEFINQMISAISADEESDKHSVKTDSGQTDITRIKEELLKQEEQGMKLIYVAGKYSGKTYSEIDDNIKKAEAVSIKLFRKGWAVLTPHKNTAHYEIYEDENLTYETWLNADLEMLKRCDAIFMMPGWDDSAGAQQEYQFALDNDMQIFYLLDDVPSEKEESNG